MINELIADKVRIALADQENVEEKKMFSGLAFMVNDKMCISVSDEIMVRIDPAIHQEAISKKGARTMVMKGNEMPGWVKITEEGITRKPDFDYWVNLALAFNKKAKQSKKKKK